MSKNTDRFPCLDEKTHNYRGCVGMKCPFFDPWQLVPGCLFYPLLNTPRRKAIEAEMEKDRKDA